MGIKAVDASAADSGAILVLGVDPGLHATGYALVRQQGERLTAVAYGVITPQPRSPRPQRLLQLHSELAAVLTRWRPTEVALEDFVFGNRQAAVAMGEARAVAVLAAAQAGLPVYLYKPAEVKQAVTGYGRGSKEQVQAMVQVHLGLSDLSGQPADAADALAVALCHLFRRRALQMLEAAVKP